MLVSMNRITAAVVTRLGLFTLLLAVAAVVACSSSEDPTATTVVETPTTVVAEPTAEQFNTGLGRFRDVPGIVDPDNFGWPRSIETDTGLIEIEAPPKRLYSLSLGHAEIVAALRGGDVLVATASFFKDPATSASYSEFVGTPDAGSDSEEIVALDPEIVIVSAFTSADLVEQLTSVGIDVVKANLEDSALGNVPNILLLGYMLGEEQRAIELADEVTRRVNSVSDRVEAASVEQPRVLALALFSDIFVAGVGSTEGGIIDAAGGINAAAEDGIDGHQTIGIEGIASMNPEIILLTQPEESALEFADELYADPALANVPAIQNRRVLYAEPTFYTTLSHWNVRGIEESARVFYPEIFGDDTFPPFTHP